MPEDRRTGKCPNKDSEGNPCPGELVIEDLCKVKCLVCDFEKDFIEQRKRKEEV